MLQVLLPHLLLSTPSAESFVYAFRSFFRNIFHALPVITRCLECSLSSLLLYSFTFYSFFFLKQLKSFLCRRIHHNGIYGCRYRQRYIRWDFSGCFRRHEECSQEKKSKHFEGHLTGARKKLGRRTLDECGLIIWGGYNLD